MGTDIHIFFEKKNKKGWKCYPFKPKLLAGEWWERLLYDNNLKTKEIEKGMLLFGILDEKEILKKLNKFYEKMPLRKAEKLFHDNPYCYRDWQIPYELRTRHYGFFSSLSGIRGPVVIDPIPEDTCFEIKREYVSCLEYAHTPGWIMLDRLFLELPSYRNVEEIKNYMESIGEFEFEKIRMVFWYDN